MFTKYIKIAQLLLLYCVVVQSYIVPETKSLTEGANSFQDLCNDERNENKLNFEINLYSYFWLSYKWSSSVSLYSNTRGRSMPVEKSDNGMKGRKITTEEIVERTKSIISDLRKSQEIAKSTSSSQDLSLKKIFFKKDLLMFVMMVYQWTSDVMILNTIGKSYYEKILKVPEKCLLNPTEGKKYTLQDRIVSSSNLISMVRSIQTNLHENSEVFIFEKKDNKTKDNWKTGDLFVKLIKSIVLELNEKVRNSEETVISLRLNSELFQLQLLAYKWVLNLRSNIYKKSVDENSQPPLEGQSSVPMEKNDNGPTDQKKNTADVLEREARSTTSEVSTKSVCKRTLHNSLEIRLFTYSWLAFEWLSYEYSAVGGRSFNDFQLPLDDQTFSLPTEESGLQDEEITIKDFLENVKLTKRQLNENLKISEETTTGADDNDSSQKLQNINHTRAKRSDLDFDDLANLEQLKFTLTTYRWVSNIIIHKTLGETSLSDLFPSLRECQTMFPVKGYSKRIIDFEKMSDEIINYVTKSRTVS